MNGFTDKHSLIEELRKIKRDETKLLLNLDKLPPNEFHAATKALDNIFL